jgi:hypothetical protein
MNAEGKIEYQLTPELADQLLSETADLRSVGVIKHKWRSPIIVGLMLSIFLFWQNYPLSGKLTIGDLNLSMAYNIFATLMLIILGFGVGFGYVLYFRKRVRALAREKARMQIIGSETFRKVFWDDSGLTMASTSWETKVKWQIVDKIVQEKIGIHIYAFGKILFSVPKSVLPVNIPSDELIRSWNSFIAEAKQIKP